MEVVEVSGKDFGPFAEFTLPLWKQGLTWVGGDNRDTESADNNGSGKSTLFKALPWCLWGDTIDGEKGDKVIRNGAKLARVETKLRDEKGGIWKVVRERRKGSPSLQLLQPDGQPFKSDKDDIQDKITDMVGLDFKAYKNTILYGQNDTSRFANPRTKDVERKDTLHRAMRTDVLKECHDWALKQGRDLRAAIATAEAEIAKIEARAGEYNLAGIKAAHAAFEEERAEQMNGCVEEAKQYRDRAKKALEDVPAYETTLGDERPGLKKQIKTCQTAIGIAEKAAEEAKALDVQAEVLKEKRDEIQTRIQEQDMVERQASQQLALLKGAKCPTCTAPLASGDGAKHKHSLAEKAKAAAKQLAADQNAENLLEGQLGDLQEKIDRAEETAAGAIRMEREIGRLKERIAALDRAADAEQARIAAAQEKSRHYAELAKKSLASAKDWEARDNPHDEAFRKAKAKLAEFKTARADWEAKRDAKADEQAHIEFWVRGFGNQGLPSYILDSVMPFITERANHYLGTLSDGDITMEFSTQRELKSAKGEVRDEIDIKWEIEGVSDYPPSGGQQKKMEIATDLALMDLVSSREGGSLDLLMMDEVLDGLDAEGRARVLQLLHELRARRGSIYVISHEDDVAEIFEKSITVVKDDGVARLEITA